MELEGRRVLVLGLGVSGRSAAVFLAERGAEVVAADERPLEALGDLSALTGRALLRCGESLPDPADFDLVVPSPGVPRERYAARARRVLGDVELAARALSVPIVAITGTNGKSTTTRLVECMLRASGLRARAAGNLGEPALSLVGEALDVAVLEVSSFQLESVERFHPRVAALLNLSEDHLDRHGSFDAYAAAKARIFERQEGEDTLIVNADDDRVVDLAKNARSRVKRFSLERPARADATWDAGSILIDGERLPVEVPHLPGLHNRRNILAALLAAKAAGADSSAAARSLADFRGLPHRSEVVGRKAGVLYVNDSKATNPGAAVAALESFAEPVVWIAGGRGKGLDLRSLSTSARKHAKVALLYGESAIEIDAALGGALPTQRVPDLASAVAEAARRAAPGDVVLLAPACASFDQFANFEERGVHFRGLVADLSEDAGA